MKFNAYVQVVSLNKFRVIDTAKDVNAIVKRIGKKSNKYPEDTVFVRVDIECPLVSLRTDEQIGCEIVNNALTAAVVAGVDAKTALDRLVAAGLIEYVNVEEVKEDK